MSFDATALLGIGRCALERVLRDDLALLVLSTDRP